MPTVFTIGLHHRPGELASFASFMAEKEVNLDAIAGAVHGDHAIVTFIPDGAEAARKALGEVGAPFEEQEALVVDVPNRPGELAQVAQRLGEAGSNITALLPLPAGDRVRLAFAFEDPARARKALE